MSNNLPPNLHMILTSDHEIIAQELLQLDSWSSSFHFTNGTFMRSSETVIPTVLSGFDYSRDACYALNDDVFIIAVNSDVSMQGIMDAKNASDEERNSVESQEVRALKVAVPLAERFPDLKVGVVFYDEDTPTDLYTKLFEANILMASLFKWGYGTDPNAPRIEGADLFQKTFAFPMPNDDKPVCYDLTERQDQTGQVKIVKLTETYDAQGRPYYPPRDVSVKPQPQPPAPPLPPSMG